MDWISVATIILAILGSLLGSISPILARREKARGKTASEALGLPRLSSGQFVLLSFAILVVAFGALTAWQYRDQWPADRDTTYFIAWLFLAMVGGMFVQVLSSNYRLGNPLFDVDASRLIYPLLFSASSPKCVGNFRHF